MAIRVEVT